MQHNTTYNDPFSCITKMRFITKIKYKYFITKHLKARNKIQLYLTGIPSSDLKRIVHSEVPQPENHCKCLKTLTVTLGV